MKDRNWRRRVLALMMAASMAFPADGMTVLAADAIVLKEDNLAGSTTVLEGDDLAESATVLEENDLTGSAIVLEEDDLAGSATVLEEDNLTGNAIVLEEEPFEWEDVLVGEEVPEEEEGLSAESPDPEQEWDDLIEEEGAPAEVLEEELPITTVSGMHYGQVGDASDGRKTVRRARRAPSKNGQAAVFDTCYGDQLDEISKNIYDAIVDAWVTKGGTADIEYNLSEPVTFLSTARIVNGQVVHDEENDAEYQSAAKKIGAWITGAVDAVVYDYPELFWISDYGYGWQNTWTGTSDGVWDTISLINISGVERYSGAKTEAAAFTQAVDGVEAELRAGLGDQATRYETLRAIHDYVCNTVSYKENDYAHTAAGVFLHGNQVVCEGYAKAFKILCDRFGIPCVLVIGGANTGSSMEDHMWNHVKMGDGAWYLVDATWDDQSSGMVDQYFLAGSSTEGFRMVISEERTIFTQFSTGLDAKEFAAPVLSAEKYHEWLQSSGTEPTCTKAGSAAWVCSLCGETKTGELAPIDHKFTDYHSNGDATCAADGTKTASCDYGCGTMDTITDEGSRLTEHTWEEGVITREATCIEKGEITFTCRVCKEQKTEETAVTGHKFTDYHSNGDATCTEDGTKTAFCDYGCGTMDTITDEGSRLIAHLWDAGVITKAPGCTEKGEKTFTCTICKETRTEEIAASGHQLTKTAAKAATTAAAGNKEYYTCTVCKKIFSDAKGTKETKQSDTVIPKLPNPEGDPNDKASIAGTEKAITAMSDTAEPAGSSFAKIQVKSSKQTNSSITVSWNKVSGADGYIIYGNQCGKGKPFRRLAKQSKTSFTYKKLKKGTYYKFSVAAYKKENGKETIIASGKTIHVATRGGKVTNVSKVKLNKTKAALKKGGTIKVKATAVKQSGKLTLKTHRKIKFESSNTKIATVDKNGKIKAKGKGTCYVYAYSQNGVYSRVKITVK